MTFAAYEIRDGLEFSHEGRDEVAGIIGTIRTGQGLPVVTAETLEEFEQKVRAYFFDQPSAVLWLTKGNGLVYRMMWNKPFNDAVSKATQRESIVVVLLIFCVTCLIAASVSLAGVWALLGFVGIVGLYATLIWLGLFNEIELGFICEIVLILVMLTIPAVKKIQAKAIQPSEIVEDVSR